MAPGVVPCAGPSDVAHTLEFGQTMLLPLAVRAGGHSRLGFAMCDGGVVIELSASNVLRLNQNIKPDGPSNA
jgi:FAD/FMN-containing dehydrogenase